MNQLTKFFFQYFHEWQASIWLLNSNIQRRLQNGLSLNFGHFIINISKSTNTSMTSYSPKLFISCDKTQNTQTQKNNIRPKFSNIYLVKSISNICLNVCFLSPSSSGGAEEVHASLIIFVITIKNHKFIFYQLVHHLLLIVKVRQLRSMSTIFVVYH